MKLSHGPCVSDVEIFLCRSMVIPKPRFFYNLNEQL